MIVKHHANAKAETLAHCVHNPVCIFSVKLCKIYTNTKFSMISANLGILKNQQNPTNQTLSLVSFIFENPEGQ